nr:hypothetical protein [uncultured Rhodopila sp.]
MNKARCQRCRLEFEYATEHEPAFCGPCHVAAIAEIAERSEPKGANESPVSGTDFKVQSDFKRLTPELHGPNRLADLDGEVGDDGRFTVTEGLTDGPGAYGWCVHDWNNNIIYAVWLRINARVWNEQAEELGFVVE